MPIIGILASAITGNLGLSVDYLVVAGGGGGGQVKHCKVVVVQVVCVLL
jgi:hypothetical protein